MKKYTAWLAALLLLAGIVSGCAEKPDGGEHMDPDIEIYNETYEPGVIDTYYPTAEPLVADHVVGRDKADPTGVRDATDGIQSVLNACAESGGGTVFLPRGKYRLTSNLSIPSFVYLQGDYNDPDGEGFSGYYGTVLLADVAQARTETRSQFLADRSDPYANFPALLTVGGSAGLIGVTVYYPEQNAADVTPYPFTVEIPSFAGVGGSINHMAPTVRNLTLLNSYKGVCASVTPAGDGKSAANEVLHLENIKGTALYQGMQLYNSSEVGVVRDVRFSNAYWFGSASQYATEELGALDRFTKTHGTGLLLGDLEWDTFTNISVEGYKIGVRISDGLRRFIAGQPEIYYIGQFYNLSATDCVTALRVDDLYQNMGVNIAGGTLEGSAYAVNDRYDGNSRIRLLGVELKGRVYGDSVYSSGGEEAFTALEETGALPEPAVASPGRVRAVLFDAVKEYFANAKGTSDTSAQIQQALDVAGRMGGGIVYLPAGYYRLTAPLTVPAGVELRGAAAANTRDQIGMSKGTVLLGDCGYVPDEASARTAQALVTLNGDGAGISGIRVVYPNNPPLLGGEVSFRWHSYAVRAKGNGNYVKYMSFVGVPFGIEFAGEGMLQGGFVTGVNGTFYRNGLHAENIDGLRVEEMLSNASVIARNNYKTLFPAEFSSGWPVDGPLMSKMYDDITRPHSVFMHFENCGAQVANSFTFASNTVISAESSRLKVYNTSGDNLKLNGKLFEIRGGSLTAVNIMRYQGTFLDAQEGAVCTVLNRLSLHMNTDSDVVNGTEVETVRLTDAGAPDVDDEPAVYRKT